MSTIYEEPKVQAESEVKVEEEKKETLGERLARELAEKTKAVLDSVRSDLDVNTAESCAKEPVVSRVKGTVDKLSVFTSASNIRFTTGSGLFILDADAPIVQDPVTGIVVVSLVEQEAPVAERQTQQS